MNGFEDRSWSATYSSWPTQSHNVLFFHQISFPRLFLKKRYFKGFKRNPYPLIRFELADGNPTQSHIVNYFYIRSNFWILPPIFQGCIGNQLKATGAAICLRSIGILLKYWLFFCSGWKWCLIAELLDDWTVQLQPACMQPCNPVQPLFFVLFPSMAPSIVCLGGITPPWNAMHCRFQSQQKIQPKTARSLQSLTQCQFLHMHIYANLGCLS